MAIDTYGILTLLIVFTAIFSYVNFRFIKLPATIGIMLISLICSLATIALGKFYPHIIDRPAAIVASIDFETLLMRVMLSFLLFAGAIHIDLNKLKKQLVPVTVYATVGIVISMIIIGFLMYFGFRLFGFELPMIYCMLFGCLISPTDPIAVLGILKEAKIPATIEMKIAGESLFNDGVGVVIFISILEIAESGFGDSPILQISGLFIKEAGGGILWGLTLGYAGYYLLRSIDNYKVEVLITIAMVMGGYLFASFLHISGPLSIVIAGIIMGNKGKNEAMSDVTKDYVNKFWELLDEMLNAMLFMLIGLELFILDFDLGSLWVGLIAIPVVLLARLLSVFLPTLVLSLRRSFEKHLIPILTWGGLRGGISVALALSIPRNEYRNVLLTTTYIVVVFSILVQGLTIGKVARKLAVPTTPSPAASI